MTAMPHAFRSRVAKLSLFLAISFSCFVLLVPARSDVRGCHCEGLTLSEMQKQRDCSLCVEAEKQPPYVEIFFLKDANPTKPNRLLVLPKAHEPGAHSLASLSPELRHLLWATAITKAQETWGDGWAIAYNGDERRTQCHTHLHIGKLLPDQEGGQPLVVKGAADIPVPTDGTGLWVHPAEGKLHVHLGQQVNETVLMR